MTLERAAELVHMLGTVDRDAAIDLFCHFDDYFELNTPDGDKIKEFARLCKYQVATNAVVTT